MLFDVEADNIHMAKLIVPEKYRKILLETVHDNLISGHLGVRKTNDRISTEFCFPKLSAYVSEYIRKCHESQMTAKKRTADRAPLYETPIIRNAMECVYLDFLGEINPTSSSGKKYILIFLDEATNYIELYPLASLRAEGVCKVLIDIFSRLGVAKTVRTDLGTHFKNKLVMGLHKVL